MARRRRDRFDLGPAYSLPEVARGGPEVDLPAPDPVLAWVQFADFILEVEASVLAHTECAVLVEWGSGKERTAPGCGATRSGVVSRQKVSAVASRLDA
jgi:hypothetical protein